MLLKLFDFSIVHFTLGITNLPVPNNFEIFPLSLNRFAVGEPQSPLPLKLVAEAIAYILKPAFEFEMSFDLDSVLIYASR